jgi:methionyl-tRNA formyltransferase
MDAKMDHGPILAEVTVPYDAETTDYLALEEKLGAIAGAGS